jgi:hypothetical protein
MIHSAKHQPLYDETKIMAPLVVGDTKTLFITPNNITWTVLCGDDSKLWDTSTWNTTQTWLLLWFKVKPFPSHILMLLISILLHSSSILM